MLFKNWVNISHCLTKALFDCSRNMIFACIKIVKFFHQINLFEITECKIAFPRQADVVAERRQAPGGKKAQFLKNSKTKKSELEMRQVPKVYGSLHV